MMAEVSTSAIVFCAKLHCNHRLAKITLEHAGLIQCSLRKATQLEEPCLPW